MYSLRFYMAHTHLYTIICLISHTTPNIICHLFIQQTSIELGPLKIKERFQPANKFYEHRMLVYFIYCYISSTQHSAWHIGGTQ